MTISGIELWYAAGCATGLIIACGLWWIHDKLRDKILLSAARSGTPAKIGEGYYYIVPLVLFNDKRTGALRR